MSLYHETANILALPVETAGGLKTRIYSNKSLKCPASQIYALAIETCKWSPVLKEVIEESQLLQLERKGIALPASHGLRAAVERHKTCLRAEFIRARVRRGIATVESLKSEIEGHYQTCYPRWVRINTALTCLEEQLKTTFSDFEQVSTIDEVMQVKEKRLCVDPHVPNLVAASPNHDFSRTAAYKNGSIILQDKASCFPAYLLNPKPEDGDVIDACAAPGNKTTHLAAILLERQAQDLAMVKVHAIEHDAARAITLREMVAKAGVASICNIDQMNFLQTNPEDSRWSNVGSILLDPSCSGSGIVGRDYMPALELPRTNVAELAMQKRSSSMKRKASGNSVNAASSNGRNSGKKRRIIESPGNNGTNGGFLTSKDEDQNKAEDDKVDSLRLAKLASFQLSMLLHAFTFPSVRCVTYSTCSVYVEENEQVVAEALRSDVAKAHGWRIMRRGEQVEGLRKWDVRGKVIAGGEPVDDSEEVIAEALIRTNKDDGKGVMGFFVAGFVRDTDARKANGSSHTRAENGPDEVQHDDSDEWEGFDD